MCFERFLEAMRCGRVTNCNALLSAELRPAPHRPLRHNGQCNNWVKRAPNAGLLGCHAHADCRVALVISFDKRFPNMYYSMPLQH